MNDPSNTISPEWHNENALRAYPLADDCKAAEEIPSWLLVDLRVTAWCGYDRIFVSSVFLSATLVSVAISGASGDNQPVGLLVKTVTRDELEPGRAYAMDVLDADGVSCGTIAFGEIPADAQPLRLTFGKDESPVSGNTVSYVKGAGVTRLIDPVHGTEASGIIDLSGNSEFRTYVDPADPKTIVIELTDLYRDLTTSVCSSSPSYDHCGDTPVKTINGVPPDAHGTIHLKFK